MNTVNNNECVMNKYTYEEINNLVYIGLKYSCGDLCQRLSNPSNDDIEEVIIRIGDDHSTGHIVNEILNFAKKVSNRLYHEFGYAKRVDHLVDLINRFDLLPYELRTDLGQDTELVNNKTKH